MKTHKPTLAQTSWHPKTEVLAHRAGTLYVGGEWCVPVDGATRPVISPSTEQVVGEAALAGPEDLARAVAAARRAFDDGPWPRMSPADRADALRRLAGAVRDQRSAFADVLAVEAGNPVSGLPQADMAADLLDELARAASEYPWRVQRSGISADVDLRRLPVGVVAAIVPWNVPLFLGMAKLAPALLAGCAVVLKLPDETPLHGLLLAELLDALDLPEGVVSVVPAERGPSETLVRHPDVDKVSFTGSTAVGRRIAAICGERLARCSLELGGKGAALILPDADLAAVASELAPATMTNSGQMCANQTRVLAPASQYGDVLDALSAEISAFAVGDPLEPATFIGPLISARQRERVEGMIADARAEGAEVELGGARPSAHETGFYVEPTLLSGVANTMRIARDEVFGPVVAVIPYRDEADAVRIANDSPYGLACTVWGRDVEHATGVGRRLRTGNVGVNGLFLDVATPFGGFKASGIGRECGPEGIDEYTELQAVERLKPPVATPATDRRDTT